MRTISINEEVDRSQNDVKKLKKENEHLKREIWSLRDEYEKLEDMLKKVCIQANYDHSEFQPLSGYRPDRRVSVGGDTLFDSEDEDCASVIMDEDGKSFDSCSILDVGFGDPSSDHPQNISPLKRRSSMNINTDASAELVGAMQMIVDVHNFISDYDPGASTNVGNLSVLPLAVPEEEEADLSSTTTRPPIDDTNNQNVVAYPHRYPLWQHSSELEMVREESENNSSSVHNSTSVGNTPSPLVPIVEQTENNSDTCDFNNQQNLHSTVCFTPSIEITPASSPSADYNKNSRSPDGHRVQGNSVMNEIQDMGCVAVVPKLFQVTSELRISNDDTNIVSENNIAGDTNSLSKNNLVTLPPPSPGSKVRSNIVTKAKQRTRSGGGGRQTIPNRHTTGESSSFCTLNSENPCQQNICRKHCPRRNSLVALHNAKNGSGVSGESPVFGFGDCCPDFHSCYQSEPSLNSVGISPDEYFCASPLLVSPAFNGFDQSVCLCHHQTLRQQQIHKNWNSIDRNVAIGILADQHMELTAQEIIDEIERQFDPTLENIAGVRMIPGRIFICLRSRTAVMKFLEKDPLTIKGQTVKLYDASKRFSTVVLSGLPPDLGDLSVISTLNQFGQVVAPLERRIYKGVDISERICHMHLVKSLLPMLSIAGYEVRAKIVSHCQELPLFADSEQQDLPSSVRSSDAVPESENQNWVHNQQTVSIASQQVGIIGAPHPQDAPQSGGTHRLSLPLPKEGKKKILTPSSSHLPQSTSIPTQLPSQSPNQTLNPHKPIIRSSSSAPRLETAKVENTTATAAAAAAAAAAASALNASILAKRQMSICAAAGIPSDETAPSTRFSLSVNNNLPPNTKKPLSRLMKSSPGSIFASHSQNRRGSTASAQYGLADSQHSPTLDSSANSSGLFHHRGTTNSRMFMHNQSQISRRSSAPTKRGSSQMDTSLTKDPLPWCSCFGNGCI